MQLLINTKDINYNTSYNLPKVFKTLPTDIEFNVIDYINTARNVSILIENCEKAQTTEMFEYLKTLDPDPKDIKYFYYTIPILQTQETVDYFNTTFTDCNKLNLI